MNITEKSYLRVRWTDKRENFTKEKKKQIKSYYQKLYKTPNIVVEAIPTDKVALKIGTVGDQEIENVKDKAVQEKLLIQYLVDNDIDVKHDLIKRLNDKVDGELINEEAADFQQWDINKIVIDNFLSYGNLTTINYNEIKGLTMVPSKNQEGKTSAFIDATLFILYGTTTKTSKNESIFNIYTDKDYVLGEMHVTFDNVPHIIERRLTRKLSRDKTTYKYSSKLEFIRVEPDGSFVNLSEEKVDTDKKISKLIGSADDFLLTVLCTGTNLEDLVGSKPTERGRVLTKFLGLEVFAKKEAIAKELEKEWRKTAKIGKYDTVKLNDDNNNYSEEIKHKESLLIEKNNILVTYDKEIADGIKNKDNLMLGLRKDIDEEVKYYNLNEINANINAYKNNLYSKKESLKSFDNEITNFGELVIGEDDESSLNTLKISKNKIDNSIEILRNTILRSKQLIKDLKSGEFCPTCKQPLKDIDHTEEINRLVNENETNIEEGKKLKEESDTLIPLIENLEQNVKRAKELEILQLKKDKVEVDIERAELVLEAECLKITKYNENIEKLEQNNEINSKIRNVEIEIERLNRNRTDLIRELQNIENDIKHLNINIDQNNMIIKDITKEEMVAKLYKQYVEAMGKNGISKTILKNIVPQINFELDKMLEDIVNFSVNLEINIDNNEVEFWMEDNENPIKKELKSGSGYEKTIAALALRVVLNRVNTLPKLNMMVLDEVLGKVSQENLENIKNFLDKIKEHFDNLILITHNTLIRDWGDNLIEVVKENNISKLLFK